MEKVVIRFIMDPRFPFHDGTWFNGMKLPIKKLLLRNALISFPISLLMGMSAILIIFLLFPLLKSKNFVTLFLEIQAIYH